MPARRALALGAAMVLATGCGGLLPGAGVLSIGRTDTELRVAVSGWVASGAALYLCPDPIVIPADRRDVEPLVNAAGCILVGQVGPDSGNTEVAIRFDDLLGFQRTRLEGRATWSIVVFEYPESPNQPSMRIQQEIPGWTDRAGTGLNDPT